MKRRELVSLLFAGLAAAVMAIPSVVRAELPNEEVIKTLNSLIETAKDSQNGYRTLSDGIKDPELKSKFRTWSDKRGEFAEELQAKVRELGGKPEQRGTIAALAGRGWMNIKSTVNEGDKKKILAEAQKAEETTVKNYDKALAKGLPDEVRNLITAQADALRASHKELVEIQQEGNK